MRGQVNACRCALPVRMCLVPLMRVRMHGGSQPVGRWSAFFPRNGNQGHVGPQPVWECLVYQDACRCRALDVLPLKPHRKVTARRPRTAQTKTVRHKPATAKGSGPLAHANSGGGGGGGGGASSGKGCGSGSKGRGRGGKGRGKRKKPEAGDDGGREGPGVAPKDAPEKTARWRGRGRGRKLSSADRSPECGGGAATTTPAAADAAAATAAARATSSRAAPKEVPSSAPKEAPKTDSSSDDDSAWDGAGIEQAAGGSRKKRKAPTENGMGRARVEGKGKGKVAASPGTAKRFRGAEAALAAGGARNRGDLEFENQMLMAYQVGKLFCAVLAALTCKSGVHLSVTVVDFEPRFCVHPQHVSFML